MSLLLVHERLSQTAIFFTLAMAGWALLLLVRGRAVDGNYLGAVVIGELLLVGQGLLGVALLARGLRFERGVHALYGLLAVLIWPFVFTYTRGEGGRREALLFFAGSLFLWGIVMRATATGHGF